jgi:simple sugar transport system ATP-binding protein
MSDFSIAIELKGISKSFGSVKANKDVNLKIEKGTIHGIVGENGAGKSTIMSILYGFYEADSGEIYIDSKKCEIKNSTDAIKAGIGMVHQHFMLVENFTVLENIILGAESGVMLSSSIKNATKEIKRLEESYGLYVDLNARIDEIPVGQQQRVETIKALYRGAKILILDEPTGVLTPQEADQLFDILRALKKRGTTIVIITHKLREIMDLTDNVSVMRAGEIVANLQTSQTNKEELAELMVGRKIHMDIKKTSAKRGKTLIDVKNLSFIDSQNIKRLDNLNFEVKAGEIVGVAGVSGNGQSELLDILCGISSCSEGEVRISDIFITPQRPTNPKSIREAGIAHVPEDRLKRGLIPQFLASESSILGYHNSPSFNGLVLTKKEKIRTHCLEIMEHFDVRPKNPDIKSANFSGGNQQKLILAREMQNSPKVLLVGQPTRGVDIGAIEFIHQKILAMRDRGSAILLVSGELDELISLSDRIIVMFDGKIVGEVDASEADEKTLGLLMTNSYDKKEESKDG